MLQAFGASSSLASTDQPLLRHQLRLRQSCQLLRGVSFSSLPLAFSSQQGFTAVQLRQGNRQVSKWNSCEASAVASDNKGACSQDYMRCA